MLKPKKYNQIKYYNYFKQLKFESLNRTTLVVHELN